MYTWSECSSSSSFAVFPSANQHHPSERENQRENARQRHQRFHIDRELTICMKLLFLLFWQSKWGWICVLHENWRTFKGKTQQKNKKSWRKFVSNVWENLLCSIYMVTRSELIDEPFSVERVRWIFILYILQQQLATINMAFKRRPFLYSFLSLVRFCLVLGELDKLGHWN